MLVVIGAGVAILLVAQANTTVTPLASTGSSRPTKSPNSAASVSVTSCVGYPIETTTQIEKFTNDNAIKQEGTIPTCLSLLTQLTVFSWVIEY